MNSSSVVLKEASQSFFGFIRQGGVPFIIRVYLKTLLWPTPLLSWLVTNVKMLRFVVFLHNGLLPQELSAMNMKDTPSHETNPRYSKFYNRS